MIQKMNRKPVISSMPDNAPQKKISKTGDLLLPHQIGENKRHGVIINQVTPKKLGEENKKSPSYEHVEEAIAKITEQIRKDYIAKEYFMDFNTNMAVLRLVNTDNGRLIGQYPSQQYINMIIRMREMHRSYWDKKA